MRTENIMSIAKELAKKDFIVFAGAGVPRKAGIPDWRSLLKALLGTNPLDNFDIDNINPKGFPDIAQKIFNSLKQQNREDEYYKVIKDNINPTEVPYSTEQFEIVTTTNWIVTTNFDTTFESAFKKKFQVESVNKSPYVESLPEFSMKEQFLKESIVYLHGRANERFIIFKTDDYEKYYPSVSQKTGAKDVEEYLKYIFKNYTIVFVGFSFNDFYIRNAFKNTYMELKRSDEIASPKPDYSPRLSKIQHYAFLKQIDFGNNNYFIENYENFSQGSEEYKKAWELIESMKLDQELGSINIKVVRYDEPIDWIKCFQRIQELKPRYKMEVFDSNGN